MLKGMTFIKAHANSAVLIAGRPRGPPNTSPTRSTLVPEDLWYEPAT